MSKKGKEKVQEVIVSSDSDESSEGSDSSDDEKVSYDKLLKELKNNQLENVPDDWKMEIGDMKRICQYINSSIFDDHKCTLWHGYITNENNSEKGKYVNFYFNKKKVALHRLLYHNYIGADDEKFYLKFKCANKGQCCNIHHYEKHQYIRSVSPKKTDTSKKMVTSISYKMKINLESDSD